MKLQVLISTMNQENYSILDRMNIESDAIVINQCDKNKFEEFKYKGNNIKFISLNEKGVGLSRNNALMRADSDICVFADDDVEYVKNYKEIICQAFEKNPKADFIVFNVPSTNKSRKDYIIKKWSRIYRFNCLRYGTYRFAIRTSSIRKKNINFSLLFGGGAKYSCGEDSLFIYECITKGLRVYASPNIIGSVSHETSTWFKGYNEKFFVDKGAFFTCLSKKFSKLLCLQLLIRHKWMYKDGNLTFKEAYKFMKNGIYSIKC